MVTLRNLRRSYRFAGQVIRALDGIDLAIREGEYLRVVGASGSGKSTLLNLLAALDRPTEGSIETPEGDLALLSSRELALWRARSVGMVFQTFNLIPHRSALQNVELGLLFGGAARRDRLARSIDILGRLGLADRLHHRPADLSGGEQQRVALARALVKNPRILLADEPTGNLDEENAATTARLLAELNRTGVTIVLVTHDPELAREDVDRTVRLHFGRVVETTEHRPERRGGTGR